ncbi:patched domain-containing protein 3 [Ambystoma mexicanum]|uniref:patched domain-containing protein 3 n=1 Tax=Ambystoma mexicanum TaxID=8296 RepID=UPI0037E90292
MSRCHTDCLERPLSRGFGLLGALIARHPWWFLLLPMVLSAGLGAGFYFLPQRLSNDIEEQFTPVGGPAKSERAFIRDFFPTNDSWRFSAQRLYTEGTYAALIAVSKDGTNILTTAAFQELLDADQMVRNLQATSKNLTFQQLCARSGNSCIAANPLLQAVNGSASAIERLNISFPMSIDRQFLGMSLGGVTLKSASPKVVEKAVAVRLVYYLREDSPSDQEEAREWLQAFLSSIPGKISNFENIKVTYFTSLSRQQEFEGNTKSVIPLFSITYFLTITFSIVSCLRLDCVRNKFWVASFGVITTGMAVLASLGLLLMCGVPFVITVANAPFLVLGVGVDDMFIMIAVWQQTKVKDTVEERMTHTYADAAVSITITTLTTVFAFYIGIMTSFNSVKSFCIYTGTAILFCYLFNITCFGAALALNGQREKSNRHWISCKKVDKVSPAGRSSLYSACCVGGAYDAATGTEQEHPVTTFFKDLYGPFLTNKLTKVFVVILYAGYLACSIYGCLQTQEGIDLRNLASDDSYVKPFYDDEDKYFSNYGPRVMVAVPNDTNYWDPSVRQNIENCMDSIENNSYIDKSLSESWLRIYEALSVPLKIDLNNKTAFLNNLPIIYQVNQDFKWDVKMTGGSILASRFFVQTVNVTTAVDEKSMVNGLRELVKHCTIPLTVYHPAFIYFDQYVVIVDNTIQNVAVATGVMLVISLLLIPNPLCSLWVTFAIASIIVGVTGFMAFWDVNLDSISMINLVICIGFSVDFSAHISYAFVSSKELNSNKRIIDALHLLGYPIFQGAISTILGIVALSAAGSYIFRTFFKIMFLVITFGAAHGLIFIPVFLTFFGICGKPCSSGEKGHESKEKHFSFDGPKIGSYENKVDVNYEANCEAIMYSKQMDCVTSAYDPDCS